VPAFPDVSLWSLVAALLILPARPYGDGPPPGHTGGFGEPTCAACHTGNPTNAPGGSLSLAGLPARYTPGTRYRITVLLVRRGMMRGGFELSARVAEGTARGAHAGEWVVPDSLVQVAPGAVRYAMHTRAGTVLAAQDTARWVMEWIAPRGGTRAVAFHVAANAANDDASALGDYVLTTSGTSAAPTGGTSAEPPTR
jgi:hypothetical protein